MERGILREEPARNVYCTGPYSYPGGMYEKKQIQQTEQKEFAGCNCNAIKTSTFPLAVGSINAFSKETILASTTSPLWYTNQEEKKWEENAALTVSLWPYEEMYYDEDKNEDGTFNYDTRMANVREFLRSLEEKDKRSLIFYYSSYSNPFSQDDAKRHAVVGISRLEKDGGIDAI